MQTIDVNNSITVHKSISSTINKQPRGDREVYFSQHTSFKVSSAYTVGKYGGTPDRKSFLYRSEKTNI